MSSSVFRAASDFPIGGCFAGLCRVFYFAVISSCATICLGAEPVTFWASDEGTRDCLRVLGGSRLKIEVFDVADEVIVRRLTRMSASNKLIIFASRGQIDPIVAERLNNQGHAIFLLDVPRWDGGDMAKFVRLKQLCDALVGCLPSYAREFRARLDSWQVQVRLRARVRAARPQPMLFEA